MASSSQQRTSYFGTALQRVLETRGISQRRASELAGIDSGLFSRYAAGTVRPGRDVLEKLCGAFPERADRAEIVIAHLRDEIPPNARDIVQVLNLVETPTVREEPKRKLPCSLQADFEYLMDLAEQSTSIGDWITSTVDVMKGR